MTLRSGVALLRGRGFLHRAKPPSAPAESLRRVLSGQAADGSRRDEVSNDEIKAKIGSVWDKAAEGYVGNNQGGGGAENGSSASPAAGTAPPVTLGMSVGHKLAARIVVNLSNKRCEAPGVAGQAVCKSRATHGDPAEGATACPLHKIDDMVQLKGSGAPVVLDVASAGGEPAITIAKAIPGATVHATDFAPAMMDLIRRRAAEAGVSNVTAAVADGEALTAFGDGSVDAVTCTWGLMFMPSWQRAIQEFSRVLKSDGVVAVTVFEKQHGSLFQRLHEVLDTLVPGFEGLIDPEALGEDEGSELAEEMKAAGLCNVSVSKFSVPVVLSPQARPRDIWEHWMVASPLGHTMSSLEAKGRANVRQEAREIFEGLMDKDWAEGRTPLGLQKGVDAVGGRSDSSAAAEFPRVFYLRSLVIAGRKCGG